MPTHPFTAPRGRLDRFALDAPELAANLLGDPSQRDVFVYLPPEYDREPERRFPVMVDLVGFTGSGPKHIAWRAFDESVPQRLDRLVGEGKMGPVIAVFPDAFTSLGGNQYVDSVAMGGWATYLSTRMMAAVDGRYRTLAGPEHRAVFGKSSGGYGALMLGMLMGEHWGAVACHSGDMAFDLCYLPDMPGVLDALAKHDGDPAAFVDALRASDRPISGHQFHVLMTLAMAATYDPDPAARYGIRLPVDAQTCALDEERWAAWRAWDPVCLVERAEVRSRLGGLRGLFIDCGRRDQYRLHYGARQLAARLATHGVEHHHEEFDDTHSGIDYRMDASLPWLYARLAARS
jgi:S-formylglutathione hydrolase FrmB